MHTAETRTDGALSRFRAQYARNLASLREMLQKAQQVAPKKHRGYTVAELQDSVTRFERYSNMSDEALRLHLLQVMTGGITT